jgi:hypothetical protein
MAHFEKREFDQNTWYPEIAGIDFTKRLHEFMGNVALDGTELYTAWFIDDDHEEQITPETSRVFVSLIDDDSDTISVFDRRDGLWFQFMRHAHPESFQQVLTLVAPWSTVAQSLTPMPEIYQRFLDTVTKDTETDDLHIPDDWV